MGSAINQGAGSCQCGPSGCLACPSFTLRNLAASWTNPLTGGGSTTLTWLGGCLWAVACDGPAGTMSIDFDMSTSPPTTRVRIFSVGGCPGGTPLVDCSGLTLIVSVCSPLQFTYNVTNANCPGLFSRGYRVFSITQ